MSESEQNSGAASMGQAQSVEIHLIKSTGFRVIHADGVWFGASPYGDIHLTFYNERFPIPKKLVMRVDGTGQIAEDESKRESRPGFVREMEVDIVLSPHAALAFYNSLTANLDAIRQAVKSRSQS